jgi:signal transduction histidine kinase
MTSPKGLTILVVDDTEATRYSVCRTLKHEGFRCLEAGTGLQGLDVLSKNEIDLVVLDIHLPDILGFEVCRRIKANPQTAMIPVLQISASYVTSKDKIHGLEGGADSYLTHPVEPPVLTATVKALLRFRTVNQKLKENKDRLELALEIANLGSWEFDFATGEITLSKRASDLLGLDSDQSVRFENIYQEIADQDKVRFLRRALEAKNRRSSDWEIEFQLHNQKHVHKWLKARGRIMDETTTEGFPHLRLAGTLLDMTEQKTSQREIEKARDLAEELRMAAETASEAKSQFLANMSHEIRTPLGAVLGYSELLMDETTEAVEQKQFLMALQRNALLLSKLIEEVLDLSKVEADKMALEIVPVGLQEIIDDVLGVLDLKAQDKGIALVLKVKTQLPRNIQTDPTKLKQILINLVGNSLKFSERGQVIVEVAALEKKANQNLKIEMNVIDQGIGISPEQAENLFQPFAQADNSMSRRFGGTGLGLMLSRKLAELLGGSLVLTESKLGSGSRFTLTFDAGPANTVVLPAENKNSNRLATQARNLENLKVLLVEDSKDNQVMLNRILSSVGIQVAHAENGQEGIEKAISEDYDLVLMDIQMPVLDGYRATQELRKLGFQKPIIALTAHALKGEKENCYKMGFSEYMTKPVNRDLLYQTLSRFSPRNQNHSPSLS